MRGTWRTPWTRGLFFSCWCGLLIPELFRLVHEEIGSKPKAHRAPARRDRRLVFVALVIAGRAFAHERAIALLDSRKYRGQTPLEWPRFPGRQIRCSGPASWKPITRLFNLEVPRGTRARIRSGIGGRVFQAGTVTDAEKCHCSSTAAEFLNFARFPLASVQPEGDGFQVRLRDMRFASELAGRRGIIAVIHLNAQSLVISEHLEFDSEASN